MRRLLTGVAGGYRSLALATGVLALVVCAALVLPALAGRAARSGAGATSPANGPLVLFPAATSLTGQATGVLPSNQLTLSSAHTVDLTNDLVVLPLHEGRYQGVPVWYVLTDVSDAAIARTLGLNYAPRLAAIARGCPACLQEVDSAAAPLGRALATFAAAPDFRPTRTLVPSAAGYPPHAAQPGAVGGAGYSPFVRLRGSPVVYDAPIVAVGPGPFDVTRHTNTHDRVLAVDTRALTVTLLLSRGFAGGQPIVYLCFDASDAHVAALHRATLVPELASTPYANDSLSLTADLEQNQLVPGVGLTPPPTPIVPAPDATNSARAALFSFANGPHGSTSQLGQGVTHLLLDGRNAEDASLQHQELLAALRQGGDAHDVFSFFPTLAAPRLAQQYSPLADLTLGVWSATAVAHGLNTVRTDGIEITELAADGIVTAPGGGPLAASGTVMNCPALGYTGQPPRLP